MPTILSLNPNYKIKVLMDDNEQNTVYCYSTVSSKILKSKIIAGSILLGVKVFQKMANKVYKISVRLYHDNRLVRKIVDHCDIIKFV
jgi:hypothetical protein